MTNSSDIAAISSDFAQVGIQAEAREQRITLCVPGSYTKEYDLTDPLQSDLFSRLHTAVRSLIGGHASINPGF